MKVILTKDDIESLCDHNDGCVVLSDFGDGSAGTLHVTDDGKYYLVRWEEYERCTDLLSLDDMTEYLSCGVVLHATDYQHLFEGMTRG